MDLNKYKKYEPEIIDELGIVSDLGDTVPVDGTSGYSKGCIFQNVAGQGSSLFYVNKGTVESCDFVLTGVGGNTKTANPDDNLQMAYDWLKSVDRDVNMGAVSVTNRRYMWLSPGTYTGNLVVDTRNVHLRIMEGVVLSGAVTHSGWYVTTFGDGSGDSYANAKAIDIAEALLEYCDTTADHDKYIRQTANIDFTDMIQAAGVPLIEGIYDGGGFEISNIVLADNPGTSSENAMFQQNTGDIENMTFVNPTLLSSSPNAGSEDKSYAGIIVGQNLFGGVVRDCKVINGIIDHTHTLTGNMLVGMIAGSNHGTIVGCSSNGSVLVKSTAAVAADGFLGGIAGFLTGGANGAEIGSISKCSSTVTLQAISENLVIKRLIVGGIVGSNVISNTAENFVTENHYNGTINLQYGNVIVAANVLVGGIIGQINGGPVTKCSAKGKMIIVANLTGTGSTRCDVGGGFGNVDDTKIASECFSDIEMRLDVSDASAQYIGGHIGRAEGTADIDDCYARGSIFDLSVDSTALTFGFYGGFIGRVPFAGTTIDDCWCAIDTYTDTGSGIAEGFIAFLVGTATATTCYWDSDTSGIATGASAGAFEDKTTAEMVANATFAAWNLNTAGTWKQADLVDYPELFWE